MMTKHASAVAAMPGLVMGYVRVAAAEAEGREVAFFHDTWHPMLIPHDTVPAMAMAIGIFIMGAWVAIRQGECPTEPDEAAG